MSGPYFKRQWPYPEVRQEPEQRTWTPPERSFFGSCTGREDCGIGAGCPVGKPVSLGNPEYGCDCPCHVDSE